MPPLEVPIFVSSACSESPSSIGQSRGSGVTIDLLYLGARSRPRRALGAQDYRRRAWGGRSWDTMCLESATAGSKTPPSVSTESLSAARAAQVPLTLPVNLLT